MECFWSPERDGYLLYRATDAPLAELTQALALLAGGCSNERAEHLRERLARNTDMIPVTLTNALVKYQALLEPSDRYLPLVLDDIARQWGAMAFSGATSVWETALGAEDFHRAGSLCHGWSAVPIFAYCRAWSYRN